MVGERRKPLPPYVSYRTFRNFVDGLQERMPSRIDRSYWGDRLSGSSGTQLMAALRSLGLIDASGTPTGRLKLLVSAKGEQRTALFREMTSEAFGFLLQGSFDPQSATYAQLQEAFYNEFRVIGDVSRKCIKFFIALASEAGIPLSPFITQRLRSTRASTGTRTVIKRTRVGTNRHLVVPPELDAIPVWTSWDKMLLAKFPTFDPAWSDEVKLKWFEAFNELLKQGLTKGEK